jgi:hypothetical protein
MKTTRTSTAKKIYCSPQIEQVTLDNEISLVLESPASPPLWSENQEKATNNPFKTDVG